MFMPEARSVLLCESDRKKLVRLIEDAVEQHDPLFGEIDAATIVPDELLPHNVVKMNSTVLFEDVNTSEKLSLKLVYPHEVKESSNTVSVTAPVGAALIGLMEGEEIEWPLPFNKSRVLRVLVVGENDELN